MNRSQKRFDSLTQNLKELYRREYKPYMTPGQFASLKNIKALDKGQYEKFLHR